VRDRKMKNGGSHARNRWGKGGKKGIVWEGEGWKAEKTIIRKKKCEI